MNNLWNHPRFVAVQMDDLSSIMNLWSVNVLSSNWESGKSLSIMGVFKRLKMLLYGCLIVSDENKIAYQIFWFLIYLSSEYMWMAF